MKVVLFGGTTEGRMLSGALVALGAQVTVCVATEYGCREQGACSGVSVRTGRLEEAEMEKVLHGAALCVDATHPYAVRASGNIAAACARAGVPGCVCCGGKVRSRRTRQCFPRRSRLRYTLNRQRATSF